MTKLKFNKSKMQIFVCIGTPLSKADSIAPRIGSILSNLGYNVIGTMDNPIHALNIEKRYKEEIEGFKAMPDRYEIVAIDCCRFRFEREIKWRVLSTSIVPRISVDDMLRDISFDDICIGVNSFRYADVDDFKYKHSTTWEMIQTCELVDDSKYVSLAAEVADDIINILNYGSDVSEF